MNRHGGPRKESKRVYTPLNRELKKKDNKCQPISAAFWEWSGIALSCIDVKTYAGQGIVLVESRKKNCAPPNLIQLFVSTYCHLVGQKNKLWNPVLLAIAALPDLPLSEIKEHLMNRHLASEKLNYSDPTSPIGQMARWNVKQASSTSHDVKRFKVPIAKTGILPGSHKDNTDWDTLEEINRLCFDLREARKAIIDGFISWHQGDSPPDERPYFECRKRWVRLGLRKLPGLQNCRFETQDWILYDQDVQTSVLILLGIMRRNRVCSDVKKMILNMIWVPENKMEDID